MCRTHSPGISRKRSGKGFRYVDSSGSPVRDPEVLARIKSLVIPPAWTDVWICPNSKGHLQVTGRDARGRKQSRYHPRWREVRDETKYERMLMFGIALQVIREQVEHDLSAPGMPRRKVLATVVRLMEKTLIRVGNEEYARENHSYGLTTMRNRHAEIKVSTITFKFQGKAAFATQSTSMIGGWPESYSVASTFPDMSFSNISTMTESTARSIQRMGMNICGKSATKIFTAKDFRTWSGTLLACITLREFAPFESEIQAKKNIVQI